MTDLNDLLNALNDGAGQRGMPVVDATSLSEPTFALHADSTTVDDALDLAQRMLTPFVSLAVDVFEADEFLDGFDGEATCEITRLARERDGELQGIAMRWFGLGATGLFLANAEWAQELVASKEEWTEDRQSAWAEERDTRAVRVASLADRIELDPRYRAAGQNQRTVVGRIVADELRATDDDATTVRWALDRASRAVRENATAAYLVMSESTELVADELRTTEDWRKARTAKERETIARAFLLEKTGYAPTTALVEIIARQAFTWR